MSNIKITDTRSLIGRGRVMNSVHTAESPDPVIEIKSIYAYIMNII